MVQIDWPANKSRNVTVEFLCFAAVGILASLLSTIIILGVNILCSSGQQICLLFTENFGYELSYFLACAFIILSAFALLPKKLFTLNPAFLCLTAQAMCILTSCVLWTHSLFGCELLLKSDDGVLAFFAWHPLWSGLFLIALTTGAYVICRVRGNKLKVRQSIIFGMVCAIVISSLGFLTWYCAFHEWFVRSNSSLLFFSFERDEKGRPCVHFSKNN
jgi:hypothetical protein